MSLSPEDRKMASRLGMTYAEAARIKEETNRLFEDDQTRHDPRASLSHRVRAVEPDHSVLVPRCQTLRFGD